MEIRVYIKNAIRRGIVGCLGGYSWRVGGDELLFASVYPVLNLDVLDVLEVVHVLRHHDHLIGHGGAAYQQVELARRLAQQRQPSLLCGVVVEDGGDGYKFPID